MPGKLFLADALLSLGTACRLCCICLLHGESKFAQSATAAAAVPILSGS